MNLDQMNMQAAHAEIERLRAVNAKLLAACETLLSSKSATEIYAGLGMGIGTATDDGRMWLAVREAVAKAKEQPK